MVVEVTATNSRRGFPPGLRGGWLWLALAILIVIVATAIFVTAFVLPGDRVSVSDGYTNQDSGPALGTMSRSLKAAVPEASVAQNSVPVPDQAARKVISTARLEIRVKSANAAADKLTRFVTSYGGFVQSMNVTELENGAHSAEVVLRIPSDKFQQLLTAAGGLGKILQKEVSGEDVTEDYMDLKARLRNWLNQEQQLNLIMARAKTVGEVLAVQAELGRVRESIEQIQGKIQYYDYNVKLATVSLSLYEGSQPSSPSWLLDELSRLGRALYDSTKFLVVFVLVTIPWLLAAWAVWVLARRAGRKKA